MRVGALQTGPGGYLILGAWVFAEQIGLPIPAAPALLAAGALAAVERLNASLALAAAVGASVLADYLWYRAGAAGSGVLDRFLQRNPRSKMLRLAEQLAARYGSRALLFAKFVPGLSLAAPPLIGLSGTGAAQFLIFDGLGSLIWAGCWVGIGYCAGSGAASDPLRFTPRPCAMLCAAFALGVVAFRLAGALINRLRRRSHMFAIDERLVRIYRENPSQLAWMSNLIGGEIESAADPTFVPACTREAANPFFPRWMTVWSRKLVLAKALGGVTAELRDSARRTASLDRPKVPSRRLTAIDSYQIERALLAIDLFPRCVILLTMFEQLSLDDAVVLLDADRELIETARAIAVTELYANLTPHQAWAREPVVATPALAEMQPTA